MKLSALQRYCLDKMGIDVYLSKDNAELQQVQLADTDQAVIDPVAQIELTQAKITEAKVTETTVTQTSRQASANEAVDLLDKLLEQAEEKSQASSAANASKTFAKNQAGISEDGETGSVIDDAAAPQFNLLVQRCDKYLLVDSLEFGETVSVEYRRFLQDFMTACGLKALAEPEQFQWPFLDNPNIEKDERAAKESLQYWLEQRSEGQQLLLFGDAAQHYLADTAESALEFKPFTSLFETPALKVELWQKMQSLLGS